MKVLSVGMIFCDIPLKPVPSNIMELDNRQIEPVQPHTGGDALTVSVVLSKLGIDTTLIGRMGKDLNGQFVKEELVKHGVDISKVIEDEGSNTAVSYALVEESGERHFVVNNGANNELVSRDVPDEAIKEADLVFMGSALSMQGMTDEEIADLFRRAHQYGKITAMDASVVKKYLEKREGMALLEKTFAHTDIFVPSFEEASFLTGTTDVEEMMRAFSKYPFKLFGIKLGGDGCILTDFKETVRLSVYPDVEVVDTIGAGDCFMGGFLCAYLQGWDIKKIGCFASAVSAHGISASGASDGVPDFRTILEYVDSYGEQLYK